MTSSTSLRILIVSAPLFFAACAEAGPPPHKLSASKVTNPPRIDGALDDEAWKSVAKITDFVNPFTNTAPEDATEAWIGYDEKAVYVAFYCHMQNPGELVARAIKPGTDLQGEDFVVLRLDPFNSKQDNLSISRYQVNALGTQNDEIAGGRAAKREWRGDWQAAARRVSDGYTVEFAVPWEAMNTPKGKGPRDMTINFLRYFGKKNIKAIWSNTGPAEKVELNGIWTGVELPQPKAPKPQFLAYGLLDAEKNHLSGDAGLDIRYPVSTELTAVGSINPDFKNVEQAVNSIAFTRGERFLGDTRPFFAEGKDRFVLTQDFAIGALFYSRRIADFDVGAKLYGNLNSANKVGALATLGRDNTSDAVFNLSHSVDKLAFGTFGTIHHTQGLQDDCLGINASKASGNWSVDGEFVHQNKSGTKAKAFDYALDYIIPKLLIDLRYQSVSPDYSPSLGLVSFNDFRGVGLYAEYNDEFKSRFAQKLNVQSYSTALDHFDHSIFQRTSFLQAKLLTARGDQLMLFTDHQLFDGLHDDVYGFGYTVGALNRFCQYGFNFQAGHRSDDPYQLLNVKGTFRVFGKLDLGLQAALQQFQGTSQQYIGTLSWEIDPVRSIVARVVKTDSNVNAYLAYRSAGIKGKEVYVILGDPNSARTRARVAFKLVVPF